jgi:hypothetical protein
MQDLKPLIVRVGQHSGREDMPVASPDPRDLEHTDIYAARLLLSKSYQCVTSYAASLPVVLRHPLNSGIELKMCFVNIRA